MNTNRICDTTRKGLIDIEQSKGAERSSVRQSSNPASNCTTQRENSTSALSSNPFRVRICLPRRVYLSLELENPACGQEYGQISKRRKVDRRAPREQSGENFIHLETSFIVNERERVEADICYNLSRYQIKTRSQSSGFGHPA